MLLAKSRPIVVIFIADGSHFARECLTAFTPWHLDAVSGSHPPHLFLGPKQTRPGRLPMSPIDPKRASATILWCRCEPLLALSKHRFYGPIRPAERGRMHAAAAISPGG